jgi:hypothetical protein
MGCFCKSTLGPLRLALPSLNVSATVAMPNANLALSLSGWLGGLGLPAAPWQPDPNWLSLALPVPRLSMQAMATLSAMAQLRAQVLAQFGVDLLVPGQAAMCARIVATMNARLSLLASTSFNPAGWLQLAGLNSGLDQINLALQAGLLAPSASLNLALTMPGGIPMAQWGSFLAALLALLPLIAVSLQLGINLQANVSAQLSAALRMLLKLSLPALAMPQLMASLTASLSAVAQLQASLGVNPLQLGFPAIQAMVQAKLALILPQISAQLGLNLAGGGNLLALLLSLLPKLPAIPTSFATADTVSLAVQAQALAALDWQVPAMSAVTSLSIGLPTCALTAQLNAALGIQAVLRAPCPVCDAAAVARALAAASA